MKFLCHWGNDYLLIHPILDNIFDIETEFNISAFPYAIR